ncbi:hypothetical protein [Bacillus sp. ISL-55]|uniref:hypothetical protein n=1 Tax=Bacillus sp. ISL-55 TaxID=2819134 RepID=UPI001BE686C2|nr:hypothetical protein [Bacillus sp. ISL-55]MBT2692935.1 hypothetical protein [Bacillus sp. ISL-55]
MSIFYEKKSSLTINFRLSYLQNITSYVYKGKCKRLGQPRQALEGRPVKSFFDFIGRTEATRGARRWN